jgi:phosphoribosylformylglycinamidine cyclo-ligase
MKAGGVDKHEMTRTFNCGIGMIAVVSPDDANAVMNALQNAGEKAYRIGRIVPRMESGQAVVLNGLDRAWVA